MDSAVVNDFLSILGGFLAGSGGFWVYLTRRQRKREAIDSLIMGLAHDKIVYLGMKYIEKGFVTKDEYDDLFKYFWEPYRNVGGNGTAERIIRIVDLLPLKPERRHNTDTRAIVDTLHKGSERVIEDIKKGEDEFERGS